MGADPGIIVAGRNGGDSAELMSSVSVSESMESVVNKLSRVCGLDADDPSTNDERGGGNDSSSSLIIDAAPSPSTSTPSPTPPRSPSPPLAESRWSSASAEVEAEGSTTAGANSVPSSTSKHSQVTRHSNTINVSVSTVKRYNLMVAGPSGSGKSTFCTRLLRRYFPDFELHGGGGGEGSPRGKVDGGPTMKIGERGRGEKMQGTDTRIIVTVVDTPGFGDSINNNDRFDPVVEYILEQNRTYERNELFRKPDSQGDDTRVHCCFYFLAPHRITPLDCEFMRRLQDRVAITPIVAKADTMTIGELETHLLRIRSFLKENSISIFDYGENEDDVDERWMDRPVIDGTAYSRVGRSLVVSSSGSGDTAANDDDGGGTAAPPVVPAESCFPLASLPQLRNVFAVISGERHYVWGKASEEDPRHSDAQRLHRILFKDGSLGRLRRHADEVHDAWRLDESRRVRRRVWCVVGLLMLVAVVAVSGILFVVTVRGGGGGGDGATDRVGARRAGGTYLAGDLASGGIATANADGGGGDAGGAPVRGYSLGGVTCSPDTMRCHLHASSSSSSG